MTEMGYGTYWLLEIHAKMSLHAEMAIHTKISRRILYTLSTTPQLLSIQVYLINSRTSIG